MIKLIDSLSTGHIDEALAEAVNIIANGNDIPLSFAHCIFHIKLLSGILASASIFHHIVEVFKISGGTIETNNILFVLTIVVDELI